MKLCHLISIGTAGFMLSLPAGAQETVPFEKPHAINPEALFKGIIREDDVTLLFGHVRESMAAVARGEEPKESAALSRRAEQIQREVATRSSVLAGALLSAFEAAAKQMIREGLSEFSPEKSVPRSGACD